MMPVMHSFAYGPTPRGSRDHPAGALCHLTYACHPLGGVVGLPGPLPGWLPVDRTERFCPGGVRFPDEPYRAVFRPPASRRPKCSSGN